MACLCSGMLVAGPRDCVNFKSYNKDGVFSIRETNSVIFLACLNNGGKVDGKGTQLRGVL